MFELLQSKQTKIINRSGGTVRISATHSQKICSFLRISWQSNYKWTNRKRKLCVAVRVIDCVFFSFSGVGFVWLYNVLLRLGCVFENGQHSGSNGINVCGFVYCCDVFVWIGCVFIRLKIIIKSETFTTMLNIKLNKCESLLRFVNCEHSQCISIKGGVCIQEIGSMEKKSEKHWKILANIADMRPIRNLSDPATVNNIDSLLFNSISSAYR